MKEILTDILIVGGGMTGLLSALSLSKMGYNIVIIDKYAFSKIGDQKTDFRTTAVSEGSKVFFEEINLWDKIKNHAEPIKHIAVYDRNEETNLNFFNRNKKNNLGYVIKNTFLKSTIINILKRKQNIKILECEILESIKSKNQITEYITTNFKIKPQITLAADGKNSSIRALKKTRQYKKYYKHSAIVMNFSHAKNHGNTAHEIFLKTGPLAILPMNSYSKKNYSSSLIWSNKSNYVSSLMKLDQDLIKNIIEEKIQKYTGEIKKIFEIKTFPLSAHLNSKFSEDRIVYIGDAAHSMHPIAGQGWNLGVRDVKNFYNTMLNSKNLGLAINSKFICDKYHAACFSDAYLLYQITDKLNSIFLNDGIVEKKIRSMGIKFIEKNKQLKNFITNYAMGIN